MGKNKLKIGEFSRSYLDLFAYLEKEGYSIVGAPRACYVDGVWNQEDADKWLTIIQVPVEKAIN